MFGLIVWSCQTLISLFGIWVCGWGCWDSVCNSIQCLGVLQLGHFEWGRKGAGYTVGRFGPFACQPAPVLLVKGRSSQNCAWHWWVTAFPRDLQPGWGGLSLPCCVATSSDWETRGAEELCPWPTSVIFCEHSSLVSPRQDHTFGCWPKKRGNFEWQGWEVGRRRSGHRHRNI